VYKDAPTPSDEFVRLVQPQVEREVQRIEQHLSAPSDAPTADQVREEIQVRMSDRAALIRGQASATETINQAKMLLAKIGPGMKIESRKSLLKAIQNDHLCLTHVAYLQALKAYIERGGGSRGAYMVLDDEGDLYVDTKRGQQLRHRCENMDMRTETLEVRLREPGDFQVYPVPVRPLPQDDSWFETTWRDWAEGRIFEE